MMTANQAFRRAANEAGDAARSTGQMARDIRGDVSDLASNTAQKAGDFASHVSHRASSEFDRAKASAADAWDELHNASERYPHVTLLLAVGLGFLLGIVASTRR